MESADLEALTIASAAGVRCYFSIKKKPTQWVAAQAIFPRSKFFPMLKATFRRKLLKHERSLSLFPVLERSTPVWSAFMLV